MNVTIQLFAQLAESAGAAHVSLEIDAPCTPREAILRLTRERPSSFRDLILDGENALHATVLLFRGESQIEWHNDEPLRDGDTLFLATPIAGG